MFASEPGLKVRPPAVAGSFYPARPKELAAAVDALLSQAEPSCDARLVGIVAPHAGYIYSGPVAGSAFAPAAAATTAFDRVLLIGPPHYVPTSGVAAPSAAAFATPLGEIEIDVEAIGALVDTGLVAIDDPAHAPEHALEVELPFLQAMLRRFILIPLLVGNNAAPEEVAAIIDMVVDERTLLVVSTDLSHYLDHATAQARDLATARTIERLEHDRLGPYDACGYAALNGALCAGRRRNWRIKRLDLRNSGDTSGDRTRVVGYGAWAFSTAPPPA